MTTVIRLHIFRMGSACCIRLWISNIFRNVSESSYFKFENSFNPPGRIFFAQIHQYTCKAFCEHYLTLKCPLAQTVFPSNFCTRVDYIVFIQRR